MERKDDYQERSKDLKGLTDEELHQRFWQLAEEIVDPLVELARTHTSPSIERSVLLRMGLSSLEAGELVKMVTEKGFLGKGAGHVVLQVSQAKGLDAREAGQALLDGRYWEIVEQAFGGERDGN
ncbi:MAG: ornithine aminomutase subunit alpha [Halanaerobium sp.]|nr:ornithine aminomutase subunit alpha [Halanaerobium sp.]